VSQTENTCGEEGDAHRVEDVFAFTDIDGLLEREHQLYHELEEDRAAWDWSC
jgi:hypothetical protein